MLSHHAQQELYCADPYASNILFMLRLDFFVHATCVSARLAIVVGNGASKGTDCDRARHQWIELDSDDEEKKSIHTEPTFM